MHIYTKIDSQNQIDALENVPLANGMEFHFALFFKSRIDGMARLIESNRGILYTRGGLVDSGNSENTGAEWAEVPYSEFVKKISA